MEQPHYNSNVLDDLSDFYLKTGEKIFKRNFDSASRLVHEANRVFTYASGYVQANVLQGSSACSSTTTSFSTTSRLARNSILCCRR